MSDTERLASVERKIDALSEKNDRLMQRLSGIGLFMSALLSIAIYLIVMR